MLVIVSQNIYADKYSYRELGLMFNYGAGSDTTFINNQTFNTAYMSYGFQYSKNSPTLPIHRVSWHNYFGAQQGRTYHNIQIISTDKLDEMYAGEHSFNNYVTQFDFSIMKLTKKTSRLYISGKYSSFEDAISGRNQSSIDKTPTPEGVLNQLREQNYALINKKELQLGLTAMFYLNQHNQLDIGVKRSVYVKSNIDLRDDAIYNDDIMSSDIENERAVVDVSFLARFNLIQASGSIKKAGEFRFNADYSLFDNSYNASMTVILILR